MLLETKFWGHFWVGYEPDWMHAFNSNTIGIVLRVMYHLLDLLFTMPYPYTPYLVFSLRYKSVPFIELCTARPVSQLLPLDLANIMSYPTYPFIWYSHYGIPLYRKMTLVPNSHVQKSKPTLSKFRAHYFCPGR